MFDLKQTLANSIVTVLAHALPRRAAQALVSKLTDREPQIILEAFGPHLNRRPTLDTTPFDPPINGTFQFEHLAGLFASTSLDHAVISMTIRQAAYLFSLIRQMQARKVIEIGRYKGGSTFLIAAAMNGNGRLWSIDLGEKEARLYQAGARRPFDEQLADVLSRFNLRNVEIIVADSRTVELETGEVDLVFIDGDHSYEGVRSDFERFGRRVRIGGAVLLDDAFHEELFRAHADTVGRLVKEVLAEGRFKLVKVIDRMAHLERILPD